VFHQLKWLSRQYEPGYIEAFRQDFSTDWSAYVAEAQDQLFQAIEASRRVRGTEPHRDRELAEEPVSEALIPPASRATGLVSHASSPTTSLTPVPHLGSASLAGLKALVARGGLPDEGLDEFLASLRQAIDDVGTAHPDLLRLVLPYREYITGNDGLGALRRNLERIQARRDDAQSHDTP